MCCSDGEYPEAVHALAFNGAEVVYRPREAVPMTTASSDAGGTWLLQNRAHAHSNGLYTVCPNTGPLARPGARSARRGRRRPLRQHRTACSTTYVHRVRTSLPREMATRTSSQPLGSSHSSHCVRP
ncbi:nitrilase-related carbon-nitrogen hydrolase [Streptomyces sp. Ncost-T10-10d]|uniref:nitrilase-related carbon-nitrogen hydrolase n=1 Tax=Streptomyces sp. Ncost-T10-10d TaxID=1839774 RepID=UPI00352023E4